MTTHHLPSMLLLLPASSPALLPQDKLLEFQILSFSSLGVELVLRQKHWVGCSGPECLDARWCPGSHGQTLPLYSSGVYVGYGLTGHITGKLLVCSLVTVHIYTITSSNFRYNDYLSPITSSNIRYNEYILPSFNITQRSYL